MAIRLIFYSTQIYDINKKQAQGMNTVLTALTCLARTTGASDICFEGEQHCNEQRTPGTKVAKSIYCSFC